MRLLVTCALLSLCLAADDIPSVTTKDTVVSLSEYGLPKADAHYVTFQIRACKDSVVSLTDGKVTYEVILGANDNTVSEIRCGNDVLISVNASNGVSPLDCTNMRPYWISWEEKQIVLGTGNIVGDGKVLLYEMKEELAVSAITVNTQGGEGAWQFNTRCCCVGGGYCKQGSLKCLCPKGLTGKYCHIQCPCRSGGTCIGRTTKCKCPNQVFGTFCEWPCPCKNGAKCNFVKPVEGACTKQKDGSQSCTSVDAECVCKPRYAGKLCETCECENGGSCDGKICKCVDNFVGEKCETKCPCVNGGECIRQTSQCRCPATFTGKFCEQSICDCQNGGTCIKGGACKCLDGYIGKRCEMKCPCENGGHCIGKTSYACKCPGQVYGKICEFTCPCKNGGRCSSAKPKDGEQCQSLGLGFSRCPHFDVKCKCSQEWTGPFCDVDACQCKNGGTCVGSRCVCPSGFTGKKCGIKIKCCNVWGDPHVMSFDGARMDFQGDCRYNLMSICPCIIAPDGVPTFSVHMKNWRKGRPTSKVSWLRSLDVYIGGTKITLDRYQQVKINGVNTSVPIRRIKQSTVSSNGKNVRVDTDFGASVAFDGKSKATVCVPESWMGKLCGICGNFDDVRENDYITKTGDKLEQFKFFNQRAPLVARSWRVMDQPGETCEEAPLYQPEPESATWKTLAYSREYCGLISEVKGPFAKCITKLSPAKVVEYTKACVFDVIEMSPNEEEAKDMACSSLEAFAEECTEMDSHDNKTWRQITGCEYQCPAGMTFTQKMAPCVATCAHPEAPAKCTKKETEGCACPDSMLLSGGTCVKPSDCGCTDEQGNYYQVRETFFSEDCATKYVCQPGNATKASYIESQAGCSEDETCTPVNGVQKCAQTPVNGDWSDWGDWGSCTKLGGYEGIVQMRTRACDNPPPQNGGKCIGKSVDIQECLPGDYQHQEHVSIE